MIRTYAKKCVLVLIVALMLVPVLPCEPNAKEDVHPVAQTSAEHVEQDKAIPKVVEYNYEPVKTSLPEVAECTDEPESVSCETPSFKPYSFIPLDGELQEHIYDLCNEYECEYDLILAVIKTESDFDAENVGDNGNSIGLMQIQPRWWQDLADKNGLNLYEPSGNVHLGIIILDTFIEENDGNVAKALKQYNSGNPNYKSNRYADKVFANYEWIKEQANETA